MEPSFLQIAMSDGYRLSCRHWQPVGSHPHAFVVALHGIQSHGAWYDRSSRELCEAGYDVLFVDRRGSGRNFSRRGDAPHAERLINDVIQVLIYVRHQRDRFAPGAPIVLQAVSWGGKLAAIVAARRPDLLDAVALLYPGICARVQPTRWQRARLSLARKLDIRHPRIEIPLSDPTLFTGQPEWQEFIRQDRLALREVTVGFLLAHQDITQAAIESASHILQPVLLMLAGKDDIIDNAATKMWRQRLGTNYVTLHEYPDARHTLEFEPNSEHFLGDLLTWLEGVTSRPRS